MKKIYMMICASALVLGMNAQSTIQTRQGGAGHGANPVTVSPSQHTLAAGDTLLYIPFLGIIVNATDAAAFTYATEDLDGFTCTTTNTFPSPDFAYFYSLNAWDFHPWENQATDSSFYAAATSWFDNDPAQADNWMEMGPITIPAGGATLTWFAKTNPTYRDGYDVLTSTTGMSNYNDFTNTPIYHRADLTPSTSTNGVDTVWQPFTAQVPGGVQYIAFHHNANGMDVLSLDEILLIENVTGIEESSKGFSIAQNFPNPANGSTTFNYSLTNNSNVSFNVYDVIGNVVYSQNESNQSAGDHRFDMNTANLSNGMYYYTITVNGQKETRKMTVSNN
ncbi:MAG: T9SS type A sorting domain-containing protein [Bacteroidetes bacterium]|nr:T9SS type A sorting domain-containing protein [Bacteroidota bacterium]